MLCFYEGKDICPKCGIIHQQEDNILCVCGHYEDDHNLVSDEIPYCYNCDCESFKPSNSQPQRKSKPASEVRTQREDEKILCDTKNTNVEFKSLTNDGSIQPMLSRPDVHKASSPVFFHLTKEDKVHLREDKIINSYWEEDIIEALNGLKEDINKTRNPQERDRFLYLIDKWFKIKGDE